MAKKKNKQVKQINKVYIIIINILLLVAIVLGAIVLFDIFWAIARSNITR